MPASKRVAEEISDRLRIARDRARLERGPVKPADLTRAKRTQMRLAERPAWAADADLAAMQKSNPLEAVRAVQCAYLALKRARLLEEHTRKILTADYESAMKAVMRQGLRSQLKDASWPPVDPDDLPLDI